ncbi:FAD-dependent oxidoreductase [Mycobacterium sp. CVI_P3]|uniref:FAD-dependent oxidoreductase n=1 Tax=Mycobacterium pinniadriaticum TaxID=2994102 RepID=A0ABT3SLJ1_9MYCO|nr:FAD-dependent oxidoreductase [Mycobacterium pinniadriaticum]MCX2933959.1 FAD-dependent oxidoreductase [Mycobacterium pinniadriaticum]MCX2940381.1 FAD-dependent oxidoreductase [Mycobacterium pinniadriaticum]
MTRLGERAVVLGASMAGMLAARVAAEYYREVLVVDRDAQPGRPLNRRGVPQGCHGHVLQAAGVGVLDELFPGILDELVADGAPVWDDGDLNRVVLEYGGHRFLRSGVLPDPVVSYLPSRALLDWHVLQRFLGVPNVTLLDAHDVVGLTSAADRRRVTGVAVARSDGGDTSVLGADLVIDATGRGSRAPVFLSELGYDRPREDELVVNLCYTSQWLRVPPGLIREHMVAMFPKPGDLSTVALFGHENGKWLMTVGAMAGQQPAADYADMLAIARRRVPGRIYDALEAAEPVGRAAHYRTPSNRWRRYDSLERIPDGFVVTGDAVCSFNPIYGQGMSVAALDAMALRRCLRRGDRDLPRRFFQAAAKSIRVAWRNATSADLSLPEVAGERPLGIRINNKFSDWVLTAVETDPAVNGQFFRVLGMLDSPARLMRPTLLARVARANVARAQRVRQPELSPSG